MTKAERNRQYYLENRDHIRKQQSEYHREYYRNVKKFVLAGVTPPNAESFAQAKALPGESGNPKRRSLPNPSSCFQSLRITPVVSLMGGDR